MADRAFDYDSSWSGIRFWCSRLDTTAGRDLVVHQPSIGDVPDLQDRGRAVRRIRCTLLFDDMPGETSSAKDRLNRIREKIDAGEAATFTHPIEGSFLARVGQFDYSIEDTTISAEAEFIAAEAVAAAVQVGASASPVAGAGDVAAAADALDAELAEVGDTSEVTASAKTSSDGWLDSATSARAKLVDLNNLSTQIGDEIEAKKLETDIALWPALKAYVLLGDAVRSASSAAMGGSGSLLQLRIAQPSSLRTVLAQIYPADQVEDRYAEARDLNDIPTPGRLATGTVLTLPAARAAARST